MHVESRTQPIEKIVIHTNEGPETGGGAEGLAGYLRQIEGGYHKIADNAALVTVAGDNQVVWGAGGMNARGLHICLVGYSGQSGAQWLDAYSRGELDVAARAVADWCKVHAIPVIRLSPRQVATEGIHGICGHCDVSAVFAASQGHTDPGPEFPWTPFLAKVAAYISTPKPPPPPIVVKDKVMPQYPPFDINDVVADLACPSGGAWVGTAAGAFYGFAGAPYPGSLHDKTFFAGRRVARMEPSTDPQYHFVAVADNGSRYGVK